MTRWNSKAIATAIVILTERDEICDGRIPTIEHEADDEDRILSHSIAKENVLIAAHGNSLRAIVKHLENLSETEIVSIELGTAIPIIYDLDDRGRVANKVILN